MISLGNTQHQQKRSFANVTYKSVENVMIDLRETDVNSLNVL